MSLFKRKKKEEERHAEEQKAKGLIEYKGKWGTPKQVEEWKNEEKRKIEQLAALRRSPRSWATSKVQESKSSVKETEFVGCQYCGTKYSLEKSSFCPNCGAPFKG